MPYVMPKHFSKEQLTCALQSARLVSTANGLSRGGWVRLARAQGSAATPYVLAARELKDGRIQFGCDCPHWKYRCQSKGHLCKHQIAMLCGGISPKGKMKIWWYKAGESFLCSLQQQVLGGVPSSEAEVA